MDNPEVKVVDQPDANDLRGQCESLRQTVASLMVLLLLVSGTLTIYLVRQWRFTQRDLDAFRPQAAQAIADYSKGAGVMQDFVNKLAEYGKTHPEFAPVATRFRLSEAATKMGGSAPVGANGAK